jgi:hypothetical protein
MKKRKPILTKIFVLVFVSALSLLLYTMLQAQPSRDLPPFLQQKKVIKKAPLLVVQQTTRNISSQEIESILSNVFHDAYITANACGGQYSLRYSSIHIPNLYDSGNQPLGRLHYEFSQGEKERSQDGNSRCKMIRACVLDFKTTRWDSSISNSKIRILLQSNHFIIKTRAINEIRSGLPRSWNVLDDWNDDIADENIPDFIYQKRLEVILSPQIIEDALSYGEVIVNWFRAGDDAWMGTGKFLLQEVEEPMIKRYGDQSIELVRQRVLDCFQNSNVKRGITSAMTNYLLSGEYQGKSPKSISGRGTYITVNF